jgi:hypothetical protein
MQSLACADATYEHFEEALAVEQKLGARHRRHDTALHHGLGRKADHVVLSAFERQHKRKRGQRRKLLVVLVHKLELRRADAQRIHDQVALCRSTVQTLAR